MSVPATPVARPPVPGDQTDLRHAVPVIQKIYGTALVSKMRSVTIRQRTQPTIEWTFVDDDGDPADLVPYSDSSLFEVALGVRECLQTSDVQVTTSLGVITDLTTSKAQVAVPQEVLVAPGISYAEIVIRETANPEYVRVANVFWLVVERSLFGDQFNANGPPLLAEVRLHLRDTPEGNRLLDDYEFDPAEVAQAASRCVDWYNELEPPVTQKYNTSNFPFRYHWLEGIVAELFKTAAHYYRRNKFNYSAGGIQVSSIDKEMEYTQASQACWQRWESFARKAKVRANIDDGFMSILSEYSYNPRYYW